MTLGVVELAAAAALVLPALNRGWAPLIAVAAFFLIAEMVLFSIVHLASGHPFDGSVIYWIVVAAFAGFIAWGRLSASPL